MDYLWTIPMLSQKLIVKSKRNYYLCGIMLNMVSINLFYMINKCNIKYIFDFCIEKNNLDLISLKVGLLR